jgi:hypothetical protein
MHHIRGVLSPGKTITAKCEDKVSHITRQQHRNGFLPGAHTFRV